MTIAFIELWCEAGAARLRPGSRAAYLIASVTASWRLQFATRFCERHWAATATPLWLRHAGPAAQLTPRTLAGRTRWHFDDSVRPFCRHQGAHPVSKLDSQMKRRRQPHWLFRSRGHRSARASSLVIRSILIGRRVRGVCMTHHVYFYAERAFFRFVRRTLTETVGDLPFETGAVCVLATAAALEASVNARFAGDGRLRAAELK